MTKSSQTGRWQNQMLVIGHTMKVNLQFQLTFWGSYSLGYCIQMPEYASWTPQHVKFMHSITLWCLRTSKASKMNNFACHCGVHLAKCQYLFNKCFDLNRVYLPPEFSLRLKIFVQIFKIIFKTKLDWRGSFNSYCCVTCITFPTFRKN